MPIRPHTVGIIVRDMPTSLAFYRALGLVIDAGEDHAPHVEVPFDGLSLGFTTEAMVREMRADWVEPAGQRVSLAFRLDTPAEVDALYATMPHAGLTAPWDAFWGERYATLADPDGNRVDIFAHLPGRD